MTSPDVTTHLPLSTLTQYDAVRLFIDHAIAVLPTFTVTNENAPALAQICHRLDGIPLAIELAAARVKLLRLEQIALRLDDAFRLLTGGKRTVLPRQQTLRALIDWSYVLLTPQEQTLFQRLSIFAGGWTLEAAEVVCVDTAIEALDVLDLLTQLVDKSLVQPEREQGQDTRYRLLETIRQYAHEKLVSSGEKSSIRSRHLTYFLVLQL